MREIKFRAWSNHEKVMYHSVGFTDSDCGRSVRAEEYMVGGGELVLDPVLMQFTGLKDKNGKEIYEGDVLASQRQPHSHIDHLEPAIIGDVVYNDNLASFRIRIEHHGNSIGESNTMKFTRYNHYEVIGNIYENPELCPAS